MGTALLDSINLPVLMCMHLLFCYRHSIKTPPHVVFLRCKQRRRISYSGGTLNKTLPRCNVPCKSLPGTSLLLVAYQVCYTSPERLMSSIDDYPSMPKLPCFLTGMWS